MNEMRDETLADYYREAETWAADRERASTSARRTAWIIAGIASAVALLEAIALVTLLPLKTVVPYTLLVDRQTGYVEALKPLERYTVTADAALTRSFLTQYVIARESFDIDSLRDTYRKVALWSADEARTRYINGMQASNPESPLAALPRRSLVQVQIRSISSLNPDTSLVRFSTIQTDPGGQPQAPQTWAAVLKFRFSGEAMSAEDRMTNPLGFQVLRYRRDPEVLPLEPMAAGQPQAPIQPAGQGATSIGPGGTISVPMRPGAQAAPRQQVMRP